MKTKIFSVKLKKIRKKLKLSRKEMAKVLNVSIVRYWLIEEGKIEPSIHFLKQLRYKFNVNLNRLIYGDGEVFEKIPFFYKLRKLIKNDIKFFRYYFNSSSVAGYSLLAYFLVIERREKAAIQKEIRENNIVITSTTDTKSLIRFQEYFEKVNIVRSKIMKYYFKNVPKMKGAEIEVKEATAKQPFSSSEKEFLFKE